MFSVLLIGDLSVTFRFDTTNPVEKGATPKDHHISRSGGDNPAGQHKHQDRHTSKASHRRLGNERVVREGHEGTIHPRELTPLLTLGIQGEIPFITSVLNADIVTTLV